MAAEATMTGSLRLRAPAKINWTLEVLRVRGDGYHELRSVLQTIDLFDTVTLSPADDLELHVTGDATLADHPADENLAHRAAMALQRRTGVRRGAIIELEKRVPVAAGLGGGSSDAAAVIRGLDALWETRQTRATLIEVAGEVGSDPPFFIVGGTAVVRGRGDHVTPLPDAVAPPILLATPPPAARGDKTAEMFRALSPDDFAEGYVTIGFADAVEAGRPIVSAELNNVFEHVARRLQPETHIAMDALRAQGMEPHLCGAGPSFYVLLDERVTGVERLERRVRSLGFEARVVHALSREEALRVEEL
jgi:4-diphosphocytidyl-2-C-methyl-D-erythritol kinase